MMKYTLKNEKIESYNENSTFRFPKYTSQLINWGKSKCAGDPSCCRRTDV